MQNSFTVGLVERLVVSRPDSSSATVPPRPLPDDLDTITKSDREADRWDDGHAGEFGSDPRPDTDIITRSDGEVDQWSHLRAEAGPRPPLPDDTDVVTLDDREGDSWTV